MAKKCVKCGVAVGTIMFPSLCLGASTSPNAHAFLAAPSPHTSIWSTSRVDHVLLLRRSTGVLMQSRDKTSKWAMKSDTGGEERNQMVQDAIRAAKEFSANDAKKQNKEARMGVVQQLARQLEEDGGELAEWDDNSTTEDAIDKVAESVANMFLKGQATDDASLEGLGTEISKFFGDSMNASLDAEEEDLLKQQLDTSTAAETAAREVAEAIRTELDKADVQIRELLEPATAKVEVERLNVEKAVERAKKARAAYNADFILQLSSFGQKGIRRQAAFIAAVIISNQAVYQAILALDDRGGNPVFAVGGLLISAVLLWVYGYRPFSF